MLYLDTARFGQILPDCASALREFATLLQEEGAFPLFSEFLANGSDVWPPGLKSEYSMLASWDGLAALKARVLQIATLPEASHVLFSGASRELLRVLCSIMANKCERILCTDADWPEFRGVLEQEAVKTGMTLVEVPLRLHRNCNSFERSGRLADAYRSNNCDGAFITPVTSDGIGVNVLHFQFCLSGLRPNFLLVDGAQQAGHVPITLPEEFLGAYLSGTHKWLRSGMPLAFAGIAGTDPQQMKSDIRKAIRATQSDDALLLETADADLPVPQQTVRIEPLILANIALKKIEGVDFMDAVRARIRNAISVKDALGSSDWQFEFNQSNGILMTWRLDGTKPQLPEELRKQGVVATRLPDERLRLAMPNEAFGGDKLSQLVRAMCRIGP